MLNVVSNYNVATPGQMKMAANRAPVLAFKGGLTQDVFTKTAPAVSFKANEKSDSNGKTVEFYDNNAETYFETTKDLAGMNDVYDPFLAMIPKGGHILDAGCGSGRDSKNFKDKGYKITAFDASKPLADKASDFIGQKVLNMKFNDVRDKEKYDGVWACASLLHVPKDEIDESLSRLADSLKPGGVLYASFKDGNEESVDGKGRFFSYYDEAALEQLINKHPNLELIKFWQNGDTLNRKGTIWNNILVKKV